MTAHVTECDLCDSLTKFYNNKCHSPYESTSVTKKCATMYTKRYASKKFKGGNTVISMDWFERMMVH